MILQIKSFYIKNLFSIDIFIIICYNIFINIYLNKETRYDSKYSCNRES